MILLAEVSITGNGVSVVSSLNQDNARINEWCKGCGMLVNSIKKNALKVSRTWTLDPRFNIWFLNNARCGEIVDGIEGNKSNFG